MNIVNTMVGINTVGFIENPPKIKLFVIKVNCEKKVNKKVEIKVNPLADD